MITPFTYRGVWWSPIYRRRVPGDLTFDPENGVRLTVQGSLSSGFGRDSLEHHPVLLGRATYSGHGSQVTLLDAYAHRRGEHGFPGPRLIVEELNVSHALLGAHIRSKDDWRFHSAEIEYRHLGDWVDEYGFTASRVAEPYKVAYKWPDSPEAHVNGSVVRIGRTVSQPFGYSHDLHLREQLRFEIKFREGVTIGSLHSDWFYPLQNLLTLSLRQPTWLTSVRLFNRSFRYRGKRHLRPLALYFRQSYSPRQDIDAPHFTRQLLRYSDVRNRFHNALAGWIRCSEELRAFMEVYFGDRYHPAEYHRSRLLTLMLAVEGLHRATHVNTIRPKAEFRAMLRELTAAVPEHHRAWLRDQLAFSNELRLRDRVEQLCLELAPVLQPLVGDITEFAAFVTRARNDIVHAAGGRRVATDEELYWSVQKLEFLCDAFLLARLGFSNEELLELFERNEQYRIVRKFGRSIAAATD